MLKQRRAQARRAGGLTPGNGTHRTNNFRRGRILENIAPDTQLHCLKKNVGVFIHSKQQNLEFGVSTEEFDQQGRVVPIAETICQYSFAGRCSDLVVYSFRIAADSDDVDLTSFS